MPKPKNTSSVFNYFALRLCTILLLWGLYAATSCAQLRVQGVGAAAGMGNAAVTTADGWAIFNNIAALSWQSNTAAMVAYSNRYTVPGLNTAMAAFVAPLRKSSVGGISIMRFGDDLYNETLAGAGISHRIANVSIGLKANYVQFNAIGLGTRHMLALEFGGVAQLSKQLFIGAHIFNFNQARLADFQDERLPTVMKAGLSYRQGNKLQIHAEAEKDINYQAMIKAGISYPIAEVLTLRTGLIAQPFSGTFGASVRLWAIEIDYAAGTHYALLPSHQLSLSYRFRHLRHTLGSSAAHE